MVLPEIVLFKTKVISTANPGFAKARDGQMRAAPRASESFASNHLF